MKALMKRNRIGACPGSPVVPVYEGRFNSNGKLCVVQRGEKDIYSFIQSHADSVDIHVILKRFQNGDLDALNRVQGFYGDFTEMPTSYAEMLNRIREGEEYFNSLPLEVREEFGNNSNVFLAGLSDGSTFDKLAKFNNSKAGTVSAAVEEGVSDVKVQDPE